MVGPRLAESPFDPPLR